MAGSGKKKTKSDTVKASRQSKTGTRILAAMWGGKVTAPESIQMISVIINKVAIKFRLMPS